MLRYASESHARSSAGGLGVGSRRDRIGEVVERRLRAEELARETRAAAAAARPARSASGPARFMVISTSAAAAHAIDHALQVPAQRHAEVLLEAAPCFRRGEVVERQARRRPATSAPPGARSARGSPRAGQSRFCPGTPRREPPVRRRLRDRARPCPRPRRPSAPAPAPISFRPGGLLDREDQRDAVGRIF